MNKFIAGLEATAAHSTSLNGAKTYNTTGTALYDLFALGAAYRSRSEEDCVYLFKKAFDENPTYAMKCLFYILDMREGQGERRFFKVCMKWLIKNHPEVALRNMKFIHELGRWDLMYIFVDTPLEKNAFQMMKEQLAADLTSDNPSLLAKWLASENCSNKETKYYGMKTRKFLNMTPRQYRKTLSYLRKKINVLERLMSAKQWDKIDYEAIPSKAGFKYRKAFIKHDIERKQAGARTYEDIINDNNTTVNAKLLYPYECVKKARDYYNNGINQTERAAINKYWDNLKDYFNGAAFNGMVMADTSDSMTWNYGTSITPIDVAISLALYCANKNKGPFAGRFMTFESEPHFQKADGIDFVDNVARTYDAPWGGSTNIYKAFKLMLNTAINNGCS